MHIWHLRACGAVCLNSPSLLLFWFTQILRSTVLRQKHVLYKHSTNPGSISVSCWPYFECNKFHSDLSGGWCEKNSPFPCVWTGLPKVYHPLCASFSSSFYVYAIGYSWSQVSAAPHHKMAIVWPLRISCTVQVTQGLSTETIEEKRKGIP